MRRSLLYLWIIFLAVIITYDLKVSAQQKQVQKKYKVELELDQWGGILNAMDIIKQKLKLSDIPSKEVAYMTDSMLIPYQKEISRQVNLQLNAEIKKDTSKPKK